MQGLPVAAALTIVVLLHTGSKHQEALLRVHKLYVGGSTVHHMALYLADTQLSLTTLILQPLHKRFMSKSVP